MEKAKIFISGEITGDKDYKKKFKAVQKELKQEGYMINPKQVMRKEYNIWLGEMKSELMKINEES